jgi:hypothetical protein
MAFYNTGRHLFVDPLRNPADTYYHYPWEWVRFRDFMTPKYVLASSRKIAGFLNDIVIIQHEGHDSRDRHARIRIGAIRNYRENEPHVPHRSVLRIPKHCILYVAVKYGHVKDTLLIPQFLPHNLTSLDGPCLTDTPCQFIVAVDRKQM